MDYAIKRVLSNNRTGQTYVFVPKMMDVEKDDYVLIKKVVIDEK